MANALEALQKLEQGDSIENKSLQGSAKLTKLGFVKRDDAKVNKAILTQAFTMKKPTGKAVYKVADVPGGVAVIELKSVAAPKSATSEQLLILSKQFSNEQAGRDINVVLSYLKSQSKIIRAKEL